mgnify:CR=1 FL=1
MRRSYSERELALPDNPIAAFKGWLKEASELPSIIEANAMVLSTLGSDEAIQSRTVLLKDVTEVGFTFFTNYNSRKAQAIEINPQVTLLFPWYAMERQVSISGTVTKVSAEESDKYFATRPRGSQIGAWASSQSEKLDSRKTLEEKFQEFEAKFPNEVPRPPFWGGFLVTPTSFEFWQGRYSRLHDRFIYQRINSNWEIERLNP